MYLKCYAELMLNDGQSAFIDLFKFEENKNEIFDAFQYHNISLDEFKVRPRDTVCELIFEKCDGDLEIMLYYLDKLSIFNDLEELFGNLEDQSEIKELYDYDDYYDFSSPEDFFDQHFSSPYEAARALYYGNVKWMDNYIYFENGNLYTTDELPSIDYDKLADTILKQWLKEN